MKEDKIDTVISLLRGIYRRLGEGRGPSQPALPGLVADETPLPPAGEIARTLPRRWCNTVRVYEALWEKFGGRVCGATVSDLFLPDAQEAIAKKTSRTIQPQTVSRMLSALSRAGAASRLPHNRRRWVFVEPTDELREKVEAEANRMNAHKAKEVPA